MRYRADINGLRAIAILFVLVFHSGFSIFPSGFIGVDIFFVISGFLITSIITASMKAQSFSLSEFYVRRLWRLQPALLAVLAFTLVLALLFYLPSDLIAYIKSAKYTTLFTSNHYFSRETTGYGAPDTAHLLLLHTWSLSIEWQWYMLLPVSIILLHRYLPTRGVKIATVAITAAMLGLSVYLSSQYPSKSYYFLSSRIFEFMLGSCLVVFIDRRLQLKQSITSMLGVLSLAALWYCATRKNITLGYPDYHALIVSIASATLIAIGTTANLASRLLSLRPLGLVGVISYSLYLWHWPIFATGRYLGLSENLAFTAVCLALTLICAALCYRFIEKPCRKIRFSLKKSLILLVIIPILLFLAVLEIAQKNRGFDARFGHNLVLANKKIEAFHSEGRAKCIGNNIDTIADCALGSKNNNVRTALMIGDSYSNHLWGFMDVLAKNANISVQQYTTSSCLMLPGIYQFDWWYFKNSVYQECHDRANAAYAAITTGRYDYVIIAESWPAYADAKIINQHGDNMEKEAIEERLYQSLKRAVEIILNSGATPVIARSTFSGDKTFRDCFYTNVKKRVEHIPLCSTVEPIRNNDWINKQLSKLATEYSTLLIVDPALAQCQNGICHSSIDGAPVYRIGGHINDHASYKFGEMFLKKYSNPFMQYASTP